MSSLLDKSNNNKKGFGKTVPGLGIGKTFALLLCIAFFILPILSVPVPKALGSVPYVLGLFGFGIWLKNRPVICLDKLFLGTLLGFILLGIISGFWSADPSMTVTRGLKVMSMLIAGIGLALGAQCLNPEQKQQALRLFPLGIAIGAILVIFEYLFGFPVYKIFRGGLDQPPVPLSELNKIAAVHTIWVWAGMLYLFTKAKPKLSIFALYLCVAASLIWVFSSQSALFGLIIGTVVFGLTQLSKNTIPRLFFLGVAICMVFAPLLAKGLHVWSPEILEALRSSAAAPQRVDLWNACVIEVAKNPVWGHGLMATRVLTDQIVNNAGDYNWLIVTHAHNFALQIWIELGALGVAAFLIFWGALYNQFVRLTDSIKPYVLASIASFVGIASVGHGLWQSWWLGGLVLLYIYYMILTDAEKTNE